jgi:hypothetical protein
MRIVVGFLRRNVARGENHHLGVSFLALVATAQKEQTSDAKYITRALSAAPNAIAQGAAVVRFESDGSMRTLREGNNGFSCMIMGTDKMCNDANSMEFIHALMRHVPPPDKVGISYMLAGDEERATPTLTRQAEPPAIIGS